MQAFSQQIGGGGRTCRRRSRRWGATWRGNRCNRRRKNLWSHTPKKKTAKNKKEVTEASINWDLLLDAHGFPWVAMDLEKEKYWRGLLEIKKARFLEARGRLKGKSPPFLPLLILILLRLYQVRTDESAVGKVRVVWRLMKRLLCKRLQTLFFPLRVNIQSCFFFLRVQSYDVLIWWQYFTAVTPAI